MIKELMEERTKEYLSLTRDILSIYEEKLIRSLRFFTKTDNDIEIVNTYLLPQNENFLVNLCKIHMKIGDTIRNKDGSITTVTEENRNSLTTDELTVILPIKDLEEKNAIELFNVLEFINDFIDDHGYEKFNQMLHLGLRSFDELMEDEHEEFLEQLTDPSSIIFDSLDDLQKLQYNHYLETERKLH